MGERDHDRDSTNDTTPTGRERLTVSQAAAALGISAEAVRQRIKRGTVEYEKVGGTVYVFVETDRTRQDADTTGDRTADSTSDSTGDRTEARTELVEELREHIADLREQLREEQQANREEREANRENRRIIAGLIERTPELPAASHEEPRESPESPREGEPGTNTTPASASPQTGAQPRPWWRRILGG